MTTTQLNLLRRIKAKPVCYLQFSNEEWPLVVGFGIAGLVCWPRGEAVISISTSGAQTLGNDLLDLP